MEYSRYAPTLPEVQEQIINAYQVAEGIAQPTEKKKKKN